MSDPETSSSAAPIGASVSLHSPPPFNYDNAGQWLAWIQQFEDFSFASGLASAAEETKVRTLLYCMGPQARVILSSLMTDEEAYASYDAVKEKFNGYFVHPVNEAYESSRFHKRNQLPGETVDGFYTVLKNMKKCNYPLTVEDRLVRDRFVVGLLDSRLSDQLCRVAKLALQDALTQARQHEDANLVEYSTKGWPRHDRLPLNMTPFWKHRSNFSVCEGLLIMGERLVLPNVLHKSMLELLHDGHQGINRCLALARSSLWWPGITSQLKTAISNCRSCATTRVQPAEPLICTKTPSSPWEQVALDLFHLDGQDFLLVVDYRSRYPEVISLRSTTADAVILATKSIFARHGIPDTVISDNEPQFACTAFQNFAEVYGFRHITSSPRYPQANGEVERMVRTIKDMFEKANDPFLALLAYRNTPRICGYSPAELLMGRSLRTRIPVLRKKLKPDWPWTNDFEDRDRRQR